MLIGIDLRITEEAKMIQSTDRVGKILTNYQRELATKAIKRKKLFLVLSITSVIVGLGLAIFYSWEAYTQPDFDIGIHFVLVVLILLNARQNLRQYGYAKILEIVNLNESITMNKT